MLSVPLTYLLGLPCGYEDGLLQGYPVYRVTMPTGSTCQQEHPACMATIVYRSTLLTGASCLRDHTTYRITLPTRVLCLQGHLAYRVNLPTGATCLQGHYCLQERNVYHTGTASHSNIMTIACNQSDEEYTCLLAFSVSK